LFWINQGQLIDRIEFLIIIFSPRPAAAGRRKELIPWRPTLRGEEQRINSLAALRLSEHNNFLKYLFSPRPASAGRRKELIPWRPAFRGEEQRINSFAPLRLCEKKKKKVK
jgi:hypothetical protein